MANNNEKRYTTEHEWVLQLDGNTARIGITDFAQEQLGDIVYIESPEIDSQVAAGETMGTIESVKAASDIYSPLTGKVIRINEQLEAEPEVINADPYEAGWLIEIELSKPDELTKLLNEDEYFQFIKEGA
ncbi:glycine cleavage system protein GcvH [Gracilibacillus caseinilyticus]|uniref:Glycine cleavage system H protein n=1 Tax=Gracilibacillus caseinilyticus TaxID=2932256 RepID=A0ABY4EY89_9BACI|nr:glycine cleavage system protein GcvH [Gracilibacillus caseinilyticus]UOQ49372.1 glycine cleavage system protein GcvH [Gracilibacillus caseinilyticus]